MATKIYPPGKSVSALTYLERTIIKAFKESPNITPGALLVRTGVSPERLQHAIGYLTYRRLIERNKKNGHHKS